jgi:Rubrerythrin.
MKNATEILKYAMNMERKAQEFYNFYKDKVSSKKIKELFEGLASMEEEHYSILERQLDSLRRK